MLASVFTTLVLSACGQGSFGPKYVGTFEAGFRDFRGDLAWGYLIVTPTTLEFRSPQFGSCDATFREMTESTFDVQAKCSVIPETFTYSASGWKVRMAGAKSTVYFERKRVSAN